MEPTADRTLTDEDIETVWPNAGTAKGPASRTQDVDGTDETDTAGDETDMTDTATGDQTDMTDTATGDQTDMTDTATGDQTDMTDTTTGDETDATDASS